MQKVARLIDKFIPSHYDLFLSIDRPGRKFNGIVKINGSSKSGQIILHSKDLTIKSVVVDGHEVNFRFGKQDQLIIDPTNINVSEIAIEFSGKMTDPMHGIYPCHFRHEGKDKEIIATQFESHHAREVFPCIDEPEAKATFDLTLETESDVTVLGNMPIVTQKTSGKTMVTKFATTPCMSTYLLAWVYGELHSKSTKTNRGVEVNVWATPAQSAESLDFALDVAKRAIEFYEEYFGINYPLSKSDHVALPDFSSGAMENWGLITYRETALLASQKNSSTSAKMRVAEVVSHELAHQWFGNLVTMKWWDDLWLNESFANMMEYLVVDALFPSWNMWLEFTTSETVYALKRDCIDGVQPVKIDVNHPDEISSLFDPAIVYAKGSKLIKMLLGYVGEKAFRAGLESYFKEHAYGNTTGSDLWRALSKSSGKDVAKFMNAWLEQPGYPMITVTRKDNILSLSQKQFFVGPHQQSKRIWPVPLGATVDKFPELLSKKSLDITNAHKDALLLNKLDEGHFISKYDDGLLDQILASVKSGKLASVQRAQLINDYVLLARGNELPSASLLDIVAAYKNETIHQVWDSVFMALAELRKFVEDDKLAEDKLRELTFSIAQKQYERLGWEKKSSESENDSLLRVTILAMAVYSQKPEVLDTAKEIYYNTPIEKLDPETRPLILSALSKYGDDKIVDELLSKYRTTTLADLREDLCTGITSTKSLEKIQMLLGHLKDVKIVRPQDTSHWYVYLVRGRESRELSWQWLRDNWAWIEQTFGSGKSYDDFPCYTASALSTRQQLAEYKAFFKPMLNEPALKRVIEVGISEIEGRVELIERDGPAVREALLNL